MSRLQAAVKPILLPFIQGEWPTPTPKQQQIFAAWTTMFTMVVEKSNELVEMFSHAQRKEYMEQQEQNRQPLNNCLIWIVPHHDDDTPVGYFIRTVEAVPPVGNTQVDLKPYIDGSITVFGLNKVACIAISITDRMVFISIKSALKKLASSCGLNLLWPISPFGISKKPARPKAMSRCGDFLDSAATIIHRGIAMHKKPFSKINLSRFMSSRTKCLSSKERLSLPRPPL